MAELIGLYQQMSDLTAPFCADKCPNRFKCCAPEHCEKAASYAKEKYGIELERIGIELPFLGPNGCTVAPHLRPVCTMHTCLMSQLGFHPYDSAFTQKYLKLRKEIEHENESNTLL